MTVETKHFVAPGSDQSPSRPSTVTWVIGAVLFVAFIAFVMSQSATIATP